MKENIYLDHAATTPVHEAVAHALGDFYRVGPFGNPSSIHGAGREAKHVVDQARQVIARSIGARPSEIIFTSGGTESDNTAIINGALKMKDHGCHIISTQVEHAAVLEPLKYLESIGYEVTYLNVDRTGQINLEELKEAIRSDTVLISVMLVNNEVGTIMPLAEIAQIIEGKPILLHTDAVQAYGKIPIDVEALGVDYLSVSGHKVNGPKGIGFLYEKQGSDLPAMMRGGSQERDRRGGTHNVPSIYGLQKAVEQFIDRVDERQKTLADLKAHFIHQLEKTTIPFKINGDPKRDASHILNISFQGQKADQLLIKLDLAGVYVSTSSACTAGIPEPSHVLEAMFGSDAPELNSSLRFSFGLGNTHEAIDYVVQTLEDSIQ